MSRPVYHDAPAVTGASLFLPTGQAACGQLS